MKIRIFLIFCLSFLVVACGLQQKRDFIWDDISPRPKEEAQSPKIRAAMLLPFSGKSKPFAEAFRNGGMMALQEQNNDTIELLFFDTKGTPDGTVSAWREARMQYPDIVIGPITSAEVEALSGESLTVPVLSFTTESKE